MNNKIIIYGLFDPKTYECFYIGKTINLKERYRGHLGDKRKKDNLYKHNKINKMLSLGLKPQIAMLLEIDDYYIEEFNCQFWELVEKYFIDYAKNILNCPLTNLTTGGDGGGNRKSISQFTLEGIYIKTYDFIKEASDMSNTDDGHISSCCKGKSNSAGGYQWCYVGEEYKIKKYINTHNKPVSQFTLGNVFIKTYDSMKKASEENEIYHIVDCCKNKRNSAGGYIWKYT